MGIYRDAAETMMRRQFGIYGTEKIKSIASSSGYTLDDSGNIIAVEGEEEAFKKFWESVKIQLGPVAVIGSKVTLLSLFMKSGKELPSWLK